MINRPKGAYEPDDNDEATHGRKLIYLFCSMLTGSPVASKPSRVNVRHADDGGWELLFKIECHVNWSICNNPSGNLV